MSTTKVPEPTKYENGLEYYYALAREQFPLRAVNADELIVSMDKDLTKSHELAVSALVVLYNELKLRHLAAKKETLQNARSMREQHTSVKSLKSMKKADGKKGSVSSTTGKISRFACVPEYFKSCTSPAVKLATATFLVSHVSDSLKKDFVHAIFLNHANIRQVSDMVKLCSDPENMKKFCDHFRINEADPSDPALNDLIDFLLEASNLTGWDYCAKIGLDINLQKFIERARGYLLGKNERKIILNNIDTYEPLIKKYIKSGIAEYAKTKRRVLIEKQFKGDPMGAIDHVIEKINELQEETKRNAKNAQPFDDDTLYEYYEGEPNYSKHLEGRSYEIDGTNYYVQQLSHKSSLFDVVAQDNQMLFHKSWKERLNSVPKPVEAIDLVHIQLKQATGRELNAMNVSRDITVCFLDKSGFYSTKTVSMKRKTEKEK